MGKTILIIDDNESFRGLVNELLGPGGHTVIEAAQGLHGQALLRTNKIDLVIIDLVMPDCEGIETIGAIRREHPEMPIVAVSGSIGGDDYLHAARLLGATMAMAKTMVHKTLVEAVETLTKN